MKQSNEINFLRFRDKYNAKFFALRKSRFYTQLSVFLVLVIAVGGILAGASLVSSGIDTKNSVLGSAAEAFQHLTEAQALVSDGNFADSEQQFEYAKNNFEHAQKDLAGLGSFFNSTLQVIPQGKAATNIISAGSKISDAGINLSKFYSYSKQIKITAAGFETPDGFYGTVNAGRYYLDKASQELSEARDLLSEVDASALPEELRGNFVDSKNKLETATNSVQAISNLLFLFQGFIGNGKKSVLVLFENNNEIRPTGGFIGTYGIFKLNDGRITEQKITSIYDLDGQLKEKIAPPGQFSFMTDHWGIRDSNWFPDFKDSAQKAIMFYEKEAGETPDAVVAVTPDIFIDLLKITGPIDFPKYNLTLNSDNFRDQVQFNTSEAYDKEINKPKQLLADFEPLLLQRLAEMPNGSSSAILSALFKNLAAKNLLFYDRDNSIQTQFENYNWAGTVSVTDRDYLSVVNANLGGRKTDLSILQNVKVESEMQIDGTLINTVTYKRTHQTGLYENAKNIDFVRFIVPEGSTLISAKGFNKKPYYPSDGSAYENNGVPFKIDADLYNIDARSKVDASSGTVITNYDGKTSFGNWIELDPGDSSTITLIYRVPLDLTQTRKHSFIFQKQPGVTGLNLDYQFMPHRKILWYTPADSRVVDRSIQLRKIVDQDIFFGVVTELDGGTN